MSWARLDDNRHDHPKVLELGDDLHALAAVGLLDHAITWASRHRRQSKTPGLVPWSFWRSRAGKHTARLSTLLLSVGLVDADADDRGLWVHDFAEYGPKRDSAEASEAGKRGAAKRWQKPYESHSEAMANDSSRASARAFPTRPDPSRPESPPQEGSSSTSYVPAGGPLPLPLEELRRDLEAAKLRVTWDIDESEIALVLGALDRVGRSALVEYAQRRHRPTSPAFSARAWLAGWSTLQPRHLEPVPDLPSEPCPHDDPRGARACALCRIGAA